MENYIDIVREWDYFFGYEGRGFNEGSVDAETRKHCWTCKVKLVSGRDMWSIGIS